jgi:hypothetical protein
MPPPNYHARDPDNLNDDPDDSPFCFYGNSAAEFDFSELWFGGFEFLIISERVPLLAPACLQSTQRLQPQKLIQRGETHPREAMAGDASCVSHFTDLFDFNQGKLRD